MKDCTKHWVCRDPLLFKFISGYCDCAQHDGFWVFAALQSMVMVCFFSNLLMDAATSRSMTVCADSLRI
jgi:hypothetical protein